MEELEKIKINGLVRWALDNGGEIVPLIISPKFTNGTGLMNPSIFVKLSGEIIINIRHVNYTLYHSEGKLFQHRWGPLQYLHPDNDRTLTTKNYIMHLDDDYKPSTVYPINTSLLDVPSKWEFIGLEDARLVEWDEKLFMSGVRRDTTSNGQGRIELSEVILKDGEYHEISRVRIPTPGNVNTYCEKNWMPILDKPYSWVKWTLPTEVAIYNSSKNETTSQIHETSYKVEYDLRGGSQLLPFEDGYIAIVHDVDLFNSESGMKDAVYRHRIIIWDHEMKVQYISNRFSLMGGHIEFVAGIAKHNDSLFISFGFQDNAAYLLIIPYGKFITQIKKLY